MTRGGVRPAEGFAFEATSTLKCWIFQLTTFATFMAGIPSNAGSGGDADTNASCYVSSVMTHLLKICHAPVTSHFTLEKQGRTKKNGCILSSCVVEIWILDFRNKDGRIVWQFCFVFKKWLILMTSIGCFYSFDKLNHYHCEVTCYIVFYL